MAVLDIPEGTQVAVLEMGMNHFREMAYLSSIATPDVAVIVNIGTMHIEHLGSREGILQAKLEILEGLKPDGKLGLNADDEYLATVHQPNTLWFGTGADCEVRGSGISQSDGILSFTAETSKETFCVEMALEGLHFVPDALAAVANLSPSYFHKLFCAYFSMTPGDFVLQCRVSAAKSMLIEGSLPLDEVAEQCGFTSQSYFNYRFKQVVGMTPLQYRRANLSRLEV